MAAPSGLNHGLALACGAGMIVWAGVAPLCAQTAPLQVSRPVVQPSRTGIVTGTLVMRGKTSETPAAVTSVKTGVIAMTGAAAVQLPNAKVDLPAAGPGVMTGTLVMRGKTSDAPVDVKSVKTGSLTMTGQNAPAKP